MLFRCQHEMCCCRWRLAIALVGKSQVPGGLLSGFVGWFGRSTWMLQISKMLWRCLSNIFTSHQCSSVFIRLGCKTDTVWSSHGIIWNHMKSARMHGLHQLGLVVANPATSISQASFVAGVSSSTVAEACEGDCCRPYFLCFSFWFIFCEKVTARGNSLNQMFVAFKELHIWRWPLWDMKTRKSTKTRLKMLKQQNQELFL